MSSTIWSPHSHFVRDENGKLVVNNKAECVKHQKSKCPTERDPKAICNLGYACDACPFNEDLKRDYERKRAKL